MIFAAKIASIAQYLGLVSQIITKRLHDEMYIVDSASCDQYNLMLKRDHIGLHQ